MMADTTNREATMSDDEQRRQVSGARKPGINLIIAALIAIAATVTACGSESPAGPADPESAADVAAATTGIEGAANSCGNIVGEVADGGHTILMDTPGKDDYGDGDSYEQVACVLTALDVPSSVIAQMDATRALDGMQDATWGSYSAQWTYHPDAGMNLIVTELED